MKSQQPLPQATLSNQETYEGEPMPEGLQRHSAEVALRGWWICRTSHFFPRIMNKGMTPPPLHTRCTCAGRKMSLKPWKMHQLKMPKMKKIPSLRLGRQGHRTADRESNISMEDSRASPRDMFVRSFMTVERLSSHKPSSTRTLRSLHPSSQKRQKSWWRRERKIQRSQTPGVSISQPSAVDK